MEAGSRSNSSVIDGRIKTRDARDERKDQRTSRGGLFHYGFSELRSEMRSIELAIIDHFDLKSIPL